MKRSIRTCIHTCVIERMDTKSVGWSWNLLVSCLQIWFQVHIWWGQVDDQNQLTKIHSDATAVANAIWGGNQFSSREVMRPITIYGYYCFSNGIGQKIISLASSKVSSDSFIAKQWFYELRTLDVNMISICMWKYWNICFAIQSIIYTWIYFCVMWIQIFYSLLINCNAYWYYAGKKQ